VRCLETVAQARVRGERTEHGRTVTDMFEIPHDLVAAHRA
jgi:hypothetical protein